MEKIGLPRVIPLHQLGGGEHCSFQNKDTYNINNFTNAWTLNHEDETQYPNGHEEGIKKNIVYEMV